MGECVDDENPAPGYRDFGRTGWKGIARDIGYNGYSWSSAVSDTGGMNLDFHVAWLNPSYASGRANGFQLRCLSE
ncbi:hypothetical protein [uncultured Rikenella sp.]|uniref:hypothetical protein n=1 Tax=uncultured Rikenella sp. TaxID=368003 RepID=UPI0025D9D1C6|nr:hypothetical protein [uncultured Rikenella sp.]